MRHVYTLALAGAFACVLAACDDDGGDDRMDVIGDATTDVTADTGPDDVPPVEDVEEDVPPVEDVEEDVPPVEDVEEDVPPVDDVEDDVEDDVVPPGCTSDAECDDGVPCTDDVCDTLTGECSNTPDDALCDDGDPCTTDTCDPVDGCSNEAIPGCPAETTTWSEDVQPIFADKCTPCHTTLGQGGHDLGASYDAADEPASIGKCSGLTKAECTIVRIQDGDMPQAMGCTGDPLLDAGNAACLTAEEQQTVQDWIDDGFPM